MDEHSLCPVLTYFLFRQEVEGISRHFHRELSSGRVMMHLVVVIYKKLQIMCCLFTLHVVSKVTLNVVLD